LIPTATRSKLNFCTNRDPVQVMMSHLRSPRSYKSANCNRNYKSPLPETKALIKRISGGSSLNLTSVEYCAAHLVSLSLTRVDLDIVSSSSETLYFLTYFG